MTTPGADRASAVRAGLHDELITPALAKKLGDLPSERVVRELIEATEAPGRLSRHLADALERVLKSLEDDEAPGTQAALVNRLLTAAGADEDLDSLVLPPEALLGVTPEPSGLQAASLPQRPKTSLLTSDLIVNARGQPNFGEELRVELESADHVELICAFVIWSGVRVLLEPLKGVLERGGRVRVISTTYMGATQAKAVDELRRIGAEIRIAYDAQSTKLHAKAWLLERADRLSTAFVGSSNMSFTALQEGLEWNVRLAEREVPQLVDNVRRTFLSHWESELFEAYEVGDIERLDEALGRQRDRKRGEPLVLTPFDVHPHRYQQRMLEDLDTERKRHDRHRNLVVAATGTGKTLVSALDYKRLRTEAKRDLSLLFVAHRKRILDQSMLTFRHVLRDGAFGELWGAGERPVAGKHVFAMVQSLSRESVLGLDPTQYDVVIVDEFHHAAAESYKALLEHLEPAELVGLTATPERLDGQDVTTWFGGRVAHELRVWEAIDQGFLAPFQYFGVADGTDLSQLEWRRGAYSIADLEQQFVTNDELARRRTGKLLDSIERIVFDRWQMRALGFCVSIAHARYMAQQFNTAGIAAEAIDASTPDDVRDDVLRRLQLGEIQVVFSVDVLGEGVDVPDVDTVLLLRPTQSPTVFTQQLGRGLRLSDGKRCLTVIDLIGQQHRSFRFDLRLRALIDPHNGPVRKQVEEGFQFLPAGCHVELDRVSTKIVLDTLRRVASLGQWPALVDDLKALGDVDLSAFLAETQREPADLYRAPDRTWTRLRRDAGLGTRTPADSAGEAALLRAPQRMLHVDDTERVELYRRVLSDSQAPDVARLNAREQRLLLMLHFDLWGISKKFASLQESMEQLWRYPAVLDELCELIGVLDDRSTTLSRPLGLDPAVAVMAHAAYSRDEVLAAFGVGSPAAPPQLREGVKWVSDERTDLFFVTLNKAEREYSPTTMYRDYAISPHLFHWESQSTLSERAPTAQRYINHAREGSHVVLFVRERAKAAHGATAPYVCLGTAQYVQHEGERPLAIKWKLAYDMPEELFAAARAVAAA